MDVDPGADDAWALFMLFKAMDAGLCDIKAITCVHGNTSLENVVKNALRIMQTAGKEKQIPLYKGCSEQLLRMCDKRIVNVHGVNGLGDLEFEDSVDESLVQQKHAVNAIADIVRENAKDIELVFLGPLTNLALAIRMYGKDLVDNVKALWIMGGNHLGIGNITKSAEFNFYSDPEAAQIVLDSLSCPITIVPWEACTERGLKIPLSWRFDELGSIDNPITGLMNRVDKVMYQNKFYFRPCDALLTSVFLCPEAVVKSEEWHASVELRGTHTRGQLSLDHLKSKTANVRIVEQVDQELFKKILLWVVGHPNHVCIRCKDQ